MKVVAIHQPNFAPWFPYFEKMNLADTFVILHRCQFEKNGYQNRYNINDKWITNPVENGVCRIKDKKYTTGHNLLEVNMGLIMSLRAILDIKTEIVMEDYEENYASTNLAVQVSLNGGTHYLTNFDAFNKYLKKEPFEKMGIGFIPFVAEHKKSIFGMLNEHGIEGCRKILKRQKKNFDSKVREAVLV